MKRLKALRRIRSLRAAQIVMMKITQDTAKNQEDSWENLDGQRQIRFTEDKKIAVIGPKDFKQTIIPIFCPLCVFPMRTKEDSLAYHKHGICERCDMRWGSSKILSKKNGLELIKKTKDWEDYIETRLKLTGLLINLK